MAQHDDEVPRTRTERASVRREIIAAQRKVLRSTKSTASAKNAASRVLNQLMNDLEREEEEILRRRRVEKADEVKQAETEGRALTVDQRAFLEDQIRQTEVDLERARADTPSVVPQHRRQLIDLTERLLAIDAQRREADPYAELNSTQALAKLREEVIPRLDLDILIACQQELCARTGSRCQLIRLEDGSAVELLPNGTWG